MTSQCNLPVGFESGAAIRIEPQVTSIENAITNLISMEDSARRDIGAKGFALVRDRFSWPVIASEMAAVYRWLTGHGEKPASVTDSAAS